MSGIVDPSTPEREARKEAEKYLLTLDYTGREHKRKVLDRYAAAVRARALADVAGWVEGMRVAQPFVECQSCTELHSCANGHHVLSHNVLAYNAALDAVQAKLPEAK